MDVFNKGRAGVTLHLPKSNSHPGTHGILNHPNLVSDLKVNIHYDWHPATRHTHTQDEELLPSPSSTPQMCKMFRPDAAYAGRHSPHVITPPAAPPAAWSNRGALP